jgi:hypothetical protein
VNQQLARSSRNSNIGVCEFCATRRPRREGFNLLGCFRQVRLVHDVVAVEN